MTNPVRATESTPFVELLDVTKTYGETRAVRGVSMVLATRGEIHALVGENGAGKSTCVGIASGRVAPTTGSVLIGGMAVTAGSPRAAREAGLHAIYQELTIVPALSPAANVFLGQSIARGGWLREREMRDRYEELCHRLNLQPARAKKSGELSVADQQMLEIARALVSDATGVLFDEPTASLAHSERDALFATMRGLRAEGIAMTLVTHNLEEVLEHSDVVTVFRDGQIVERRPTSDWSKPEMVSAMLGKAEPVLGERRRPATGGPAAKAALTVRGLSSADILDDVSFDLRPGEILGIAGLVGSGRTSVLRALAGFDRHAKGTVQTSTDQDGAAPPRSVREARRRGLALLPEDRKGQGLMLTRSGAENVTLGEWKGLSKFGVLRGASVRQAARQAATPVGFNPNRVDEQVERLSGGNQQKLLLARWLYTNHTVLLADEPTRGVDVGAKAEIAASLERLIADRRSIVLVSSDLEEVVNLSDRVIVLNGGRVLATLDGAVDEISVARILHMIFAATEDSPTAGSPA
ncbi:MAG: sugar ABC transporter ATP-binding protein [Acidimicrobiia bacterium]